MDRIPVRCVGNDSKRYDGKVWLEPVQDIVEVNEEQVFEPILPSAFKEGDVVKVRQHAKGGGHLKLWSGVVTWSKSPPEELRCSTRIRQESRPQLQGSERNCQESRPQLQRSENSQSMRRNPSLNWEWVGSIQITIHVIPFTHMKYVPPQRRNNS